MSLWGSLGRNNPFGLKFGSSLSASAKPAALAGNPAPGDRDWHILYQGQTKLLHQCQAHTDLMRTNMPKALARIA